jgi:hypothetical protein
MAPFTLTPAGTPPLNNPRTRLTICDTVVLTESLGERFGSWLQRFPEPSLCERSLTLVLVSEFFGDGACGWDCGIGYLFWLRDLAAPSYEVFPLLFF